MEDLQKSCKDVIIEIYELSEGQYEPWINDLNLTGNSSSRAGLEVLIDLRNKYKFIHIFKTFIFLSVEKVKSGSIEKCSTSAFIKNNREFMDSIWNQISRFNIYPLIQFFVFLVTLISF